MGSQSVPPFLRLPVEVRLMIYKYAWTVSELDYIDMCVVGNYYAVSQVKPDYLKAQLSAIRKLGAINQRIRAEAYLEYFGHTQIKVTYEDAWTPDPMIGDWNRSALYILGGSYLLQTQAQHVQLHWSAWLDNDSIETRMNEPGIRALKQEELLNEQWAIECVSRFKNLKTLEIIVDDGSHWLRTDSFWRRWKDVSNERGVAHWEAAEITRVFYDDERRAKLIKGLETHHQKLEKAVVRADVSDPQIVKLFNEEFEWWRQLKEDLATLVREDGPPSAVCISLSLL